MKVLSGPDSLTLKQLQVDVASTTTIRRRMVTSAMGSEAAKSGSTAVPEITGSNPGLDRFNKVFEPVVRGFMWIAGAVLSLYVIFMFVDVFMRYVFDRPIPHDVDLTQFILVLLCFFSIGYTQMAKSHVNVDLITERLRPRAQLALSTSMYILCTAVAAVMIWQGVVTMLRYYEVGTKTYGGLPFFPVTFLVPIGALILFVVFIRDIVSKVIEGRQSRFGAVRWLLVFAVPIALLVIVAAGMFHLATPVSTFAAGAWALLMLFILIFLGMPIGFAILLVASFVMGYTATAKSGFMILGQTFFTQVSTYTWIVIPLYTVMSFFILAGDLVHSPLSTALTNG